MENKLKIHICKGTGSGKTTLSAFDNALMNAGIANYNLIYLSSVIPKGSKITNEERKTSIEEYGNKLYTVMSRYNQIIKGKEAWAGIGWIQEEQGMGLFVEHHGESKNEVIELIKNSLDDMRQYRSFKYGQIKYEIAGIKCDGNPVCAIVSAVFRSEGW